MSDEQERAELLHMGYEREVVELDALRAENERLEAEAAALYETLRGAMPVDPWFTRDDAGNVCCYCCRTWNGHTDTCGYVAARAVFEKPMGAAGAALLNRLRAAERVIAAARHMLAAWNGEGETVADWGEFERVVEAYDAAKEPSHE